MPNSQRSVNVKSICFKMLQNALVIAGLSVCLTSNASSQDSYRFAGSSNSTPKRLSHSIVKAVKNSSSKPQSTLIDQDSRDDSLQQQENKRYVNPLFQDLKIEGVDLGFSSIQNLEIDVPVEAEKKPKDHAESVFGNHDSIAYFAGGVNVPNFPQQLPTAATFQHQPLYFEELNLERHGKNLRFLQPVVSGVKFFGTVPLLPYKMAVQKPRSQTHTRDPYPAGVPAPRVRESQRLSVKGVAFEAAMIAAAILIIP